MAYDNTNTFIISKNDKGDNDKRPDYRGSVNIDGKDYDLSGWIKTRKDDGGKFISGSVQVPKPKAQPAKTAPPAQDVAYEDDIPF
jgi:uncharacterized protein (DUF736 family)